MENLLTTFHTAHNTQDGYLVASTLSPAAPTNSPAHLYDLKSSSSPHAIQSDVRYATIYDSSVAFSSKTEAQAWMDVYVAFYQCVLEAIKGEELENQYKRGKGSKAGEADVAKQWGAVYLAWKDVSNAVVKGYAGQAGFAAWTVPVLYVVGRWLRGFAIRADDWVRKAKEGGQGALIGGEGSFGEDVESGGGENDKLEDAARLINRIFGICISDRAPIESSRKWAIYYITNLLFKTYFKLNSIPLSKNILRSLQASADIPPLPAFPKPHVTTFHYYHGVISFLSEDYPTAENHLTSALRLCPRPDAPIALRLPRPQRSAFERCAAKNRRLILTYLIPTRMITARRLPSPALLASNSALERLFAPLCRCVKSGDLGGFDRALEEGLERFAEKRIYLTLERARDLCLRNVLRRVVGCEDAAGEGGERVRRTRVRVEEFWLGLKVSLQGGVRGSGAENAGVGGSDEGADEQADVLDSDEAECLVANCIYKGLMKGYISREKSMVVLSKQGAFPGTGV